MPIRKLIPSFTPTAVKLVQQGAKNVHLYNKKNINVKTTAAALNVYWYANSHNYLHA